MVDTPLHNQFYKSLHERDATIGHREGYSGATAYFRRMMRDADRFVIDNTASTEVMERSRELNRLMDRCQIANLPFETIWIEYDNRHRIRKAHELGMTIEKTNPDEIPNKVGFLIQRLNDRPNSWVAFRVVDIDILHGMAPIGYLFDAESTKPISKLGRWDSYSPQGILGQAPLEVQNMIDKLTTNVAIGHYVWGINPGSKYDQFNEANNIASIVENPLWAIFSKNFDARKYDRSDMLAEIYAEALIEYRGELRFIATFLALLNSVPTTYVSTDKKPGSFRANGRMQPYFTHRTVSLNISAIGRKSISRMMNECALQARRRAHKVRGYFRPLRDDTGRIIDPHWKWVEAHVRGDPRLGWVHHDYEVENK